MTLIVVPPLIDPTLQLTVGPGERLLDLNERFARRMADPHLLSRLAEDLDVPGVPRPRPDASSAAAGPPEGSLRPVERCLLALAAADVLAGPTDPDTWLRALGAAIRAVSAADPGLTASVDDITLREGSTHSSAAVVRAARSCRLFDPELVDPELVDPELAGPELAGPELADQPGRVAGPVEVVVDVDQQLPAAVRLAVRLARVREVTLSGRFVAAHRAALGRVPELSGVRLSDAVRPRRVVAGFAPGSGDLPVWATSMGDIPDEGPWAGWLEADDALRVPDPVWERCAGLVVSASGPTSGMRPGLGRPGLGELLPRLLVRIPVAVEVIAGGPQALPPSAGTAWWRSWGAQLRLAGVRPYRPPVPPGSAPIGGDDLARWLAAPAEQPVPPVPDGVEQFPGRLAGALFAPPRRTPVATGYLWDPAVRVVRLRHLSPPGAGTGDFLICLRTGRLSRIQPSLAQLVEQLRTRGPHALAADGSRARRDRLLSGLCRAGLLRREVAA